MVCASFEVSWGPRENDSGQAFDCNDVHPFFEVDWCAVETLQASDSMEQNFINGLLVLEKTSCLVQRPNKPTLKTVAVKIELAK